MDSFTQIVIGIATVEAIAGRELKNKVFLYGTLLGTLPDLDIWIGKFFSYENELSFHRSFTHSFLGILILSPILGYLLRKIDPKISLIKWTSVVAACIATHIGIDLFTAWGVQLFYPWTERFSFKTIFVVDPVYTLPWVIALLFIYRTKVDEKRKFYLKQGFIWSSVYLSITIGIKLFVVQKVKKELANKEINYSDFIVKPTIANCILWNIHIKNEDGYLLGDYSLFDTQPINYNFHAKNKELENSLRADLVVKKLIEVSEGWYIIDKTDELNFTFNDLRFGVITKENGHQQFVFAYSLFKNGNQIDVKPLPKTIRDGKKAVQKTWKRLKGN